MPTRKSISPAIPAGCCSTVIVAEEAGDHWVAVPVGDFDGDGNYLQDLDGDGLAEIATVDINFINRFDCTACSAAPRVIYTVRDGKVVDLTTDTRFLGAHRAWLKEIEDSIEPDATLEIAGLPCRVARREDPARRRRRGLAGDQRPLELRRRRRRRGLPERRRPRPVRQEGPQGAEVPGAAAAVPRFRWLQVLRAGR